MNFKKPIFLFIMLVLFVAINGQALKQADGKTSLKAGTAKVDITPAIPVKLMVMLPGKHIPKEFMIRSVSEVNSFENNGKRLLCFN